MKNILNFLINVEKLRRIPRRGWVLRGVKNPETIAEHSFRLPIMAWLFALKKRNLNIGKVIKMALAHELSKILARDETPYDKILSGKRRISKEIFQTFPIDFQKGREKIFYLNYNEEYSALKKITSGLSPHFRREIINLWDEYQRKLTNEGRFLRQLYRVENLLQALEYWKKDKSFPIEPWWLEAEEFVDDEILVEFLEKMERKFYGKKEIKDELNFLLKLGKLKAFPRKGLVLRGVKDAPTVAEDAFLLAMTLWALNEKKKLNLTKMQKMALVYEVCEVYAQDQTPYEGILPEDLEERKRVFERWPRFSLKEKMQRFSRDYKLEKKSLARLIRGLPQNLQGEISCLWDECKKRLGSEGNFVNQTYWVAMMMEVLQLWKEDKAFPIFGWWEQILEFIDDPICLDFLEELEKKFFKKY